MSLALTYYNNDDQLRCAGYGIGDIGIIAKISGKIIQLVAAQKGEKDGFCDWNINRIKTASNAESAFEELIKRNNVFLTPINLGDEVCCYTFAMDNLPAIKTPTTLQNCDKHSLQLANKPSAKKLIDDLIDLNEQAYIAAKNDLIQNKLSAKIGDDFTIGSMIIPSVELQQKIKQEVASMPDIKIAPIIAKMNAPFNIDYLRTPSLQQNASATPQIRKNAFDCSLL